MSRQNCSLYVDGNGRYCCRDKVFRVGDNAYTVTLANTGPVDLMVFPTGDTDEVSVLHSTLQEGSTTITDAGTYMLDLDCEALDGTVAPDVVEMQMSACCHPVTHTDVFEVALLSKVCELLDNSQSDTGTLTDILTEIQALCTKIAATNSQLSGICDKLLDTIAGIQALNENSAAQIEALQALCDKLENNADALQAIKDCITAGDEAQLAALNAISETLTSVNAGIEALCAKQEATTAAVEALGPLLESVTSAIETLEASNSEENAAQLECLRDLKTLLEAQIAASGIADAAQLACLEGLKDLITDLIRNMIAGDENEAALLEEILACLTDQARMDVQEHVLCDTLEDGTTQFFFQRCVTRFDKAGEAVSNTVTTLNFDKSGPYEVQGRVGFCTDTRTVHCWKDKFIEGGLDNSLTNWRDLDKTFEVTFLNGDVDTFTVGATNSWAELVTGMSVGLDGLMPWAQTVEPFQAPDGGDLPAPAVELNKMVARYVGFRVCPGDNVPVRVTYTSDRITEPVDLVVQYIETPTIYIDRCVDCYGNETWLRGKEPYEPICAIPCADQFPAIPLTVCTHAYFEGCDNANSENSNDWINITRVVSDCGDGPRASYLREDADGGFEPYPLVGQFVDCDSGEPIPEPVPDCQDFEIVKLFQMTERTGTLRSRDWDLGPRPSQFMSEADGDAIRESFDFSATPTVDEDWTTLNVNDANKANDRQNAQVVEGYILVEE